MTTTQTLTPTQVNALGKLIHAKGGRLNYGAAHADLPTNTVESLIRRGFVRIVVHGGYYRPTTITATRDGIVAWQDAR